jgi:hypothetical protein
MVPASDESKAAIHGETLAVLNVIHELPIYERAFFSACL